MTVRKVTLMVILVNRIDGQSTHCNTNLQNESYNIRNDIYIENKVTQLGITPYLSANNVITGNLL